MNVMASYIQSPRMMKISTPIGEDALLLERLQGVERVNELFHFEVTVRSKRTDIDADELIGELVDLTLTRHGNSSERVWNGLVVGIDEDAKVNRAFRHYTLTIRPHAWLLSQRTNCRIWLDKTSLDVAATLLSEHGVRAPDTGGVVEPPPQRHYSVQWNETDLDYLLRRLQEDGLFYWFRHEGGEGGGTHQMAIASHASGWDKGMEEAGVEGGEEGPVRLSRGSTDRNHISEWKRRFAFRPGKRAGRDWNFETPTIVPGNATPSLVPLSKNTGQELYEYPARATSNGAAEKAMKLRNQAIEGDHQRIFGASTTRWLSPGRKFTPYEVGEGAETYQTAVIVAIEHSAEDTSYETGSGTPSYSNRFEALPADLPATPHRTATQPRVEGSQIAIIAGPSGEEIHCDTYGRVKVWFPWDREAKKDGSDTCWVRVVQNWAGTGWGGQIVPRIGMEALVFYENGDPDRPIIVGLSPNPRQKVPYDLPANKTKSTFRTSTHKGQGFNELSFEDEAGREEVFLHAQRDWTMKIENHATERVDQNKVVSIGGMSLSEVQGSSTQNVAKNLTINVGGGAVGNMLSGMATQDVFGMRPMGYYISQSLGNGIGSGNIDMNASGSLRVDAAVPLSQSTPGIHVATYGLHSTTNVGGSLYVSAGADSREVVAKKKIIDVHGELLLRCGKGEILMKKDGSMTIKASKIDIEKVK